VGLQGTDRAASDIGTKAHQMTFSTLRHDLTERFKAHQASFVICSYLLALLTWIPSEAWSTSWATVRLLAECWLLVYGPWQLLLRLVSFGEKKEKRQKEVAGCSCFLLVLILLVSAFVVDHLSETRIWELHWGAPVILLSLFCYSLDLIWERLLDVCLYVSAYLPLLVAFALAYRVRDTYWSIALSILGLIYSHIRFTLAYNIFWKLDILTRHAMNTAKDLYLLLHANFRHFKAGEDEQNEIVWIERQITEHKEGRSWLRSSDPRVPIRNLEDCLRRLKYDQSQLGSDLNVINLLLVPSEDNKLDLDRDVPRYLAFILLSGVCTLNLIVLAFGGRPGLWPLDLLAWLLAAVRPTG
jgi:hypothetical protein